MQFNITKMQLWYFGLAAIIGAPPKNTKNCTVAAAAVDEINLYKTDFAMTT